MRWRPSPVVWRIGLGLLVALLLILLLAATLPVGWARHWIERRIAAQVGAPVRIGAIARASFLSFAPTIVLRDLRIAQPSWAGSGDFATARELRLRVPLWPILIGRGVRPDAIVADGLVVALVRDASGRSNWAGRGGGGPTRLTDLALSDGRFTLRDVRRHLVLSGRMSADARHGLVVAGAGRFHEAPATLSFTGGSIAALPRTSAWPFALALLSPRLELRAKGGMAGALNARDMQLDMTARATSLKDLDDIVQAGLFGTQPIDLRAHVRRVGRDWFVDRLQGSVGRSLLTGKAAILKRDGRSQIDAAIDFAQLDFDDLADAQGQAAGAAARARIGPRVLPDTRINLAKLGPTDGQLRFTAHRLLFRNRSVFQSLRGTIRLDHRLLTVEDIQAGLTNGRMTGRMVVDHRTGVSPLLGVDLLFDGGRLGVLLGAADIVDAPFRARIVLHGRGDTVRAALAGADGHAGLTAGNGQLSRVAAAVLGQDMGKTIGAALGAGEAMVPLRCLAVGFEARGGRLAAAPFIIDTAVARSRGTGTVDLAGETIALVIGGRARDPSGLSIIDPIEIGGTLSEPTLRLADVGRGTVGSLVGAVVKSIGGALGLADKRGPQVSATGPIDCAAVSRRLLRGAG